MQITYNSIYHRYQVIGIKQISLPEQSVTSKVKLNILPKTESLFSKNQKRRFSREVVTIKENEPAIFRFNREAVNRLLADFEFEFDNKGIPLLITNLKEIWKNWLSQVDVLQSKYEGDIVDGLISKMTVSLGNEKLFTKNLLKDFILNEMYQRQIHKINFNDRTYSCNREWSEIVFGFPLLFDQECRLSIKNNADQLKIIGIANIEKNRINLVELCENESFTIDDIVSVEQTSVYYAQNITFSADRIVSHFIINGRDSFLKKIDIELNIEKLERI